jgi:BirA family biotin operon repressor/biotin-[acetyl-CoA-carboxylase] ligase
MESDLNEERIKAQLATRIFGRELVCLSCAGSTNDVAKDLAVQGALEGAVVLADAQTAGRGRMGRRWVAPAGTCILCSILFRPGLPPTQAQQLTMLCSLAAADAVEEVAGLQVWLKWPNDLIVQGRGTKPKVRGWKKLAGVLTEVGVVGGRMDFVVVGLGLNVNVPLDALPSLAPGATSVLAETGRPVDRVALLIEFLAGVERRYEALQVGKGPHQEWCARLATLGRTVKASVSGKEFVGVAESVDEAGALLLRTPDGTLHRLLAGDVTLNRA